MEAKDYSIMYCMDGNLYINRNRWTDFRSKDSKRFSKEDLESIERWIEQNNKYIRKDIFIEKACKFLRSYRQDTYDGMGYIAGIINDKTIEDFKKYI